MTAIVYAALVFLAVRHHEPWADEAHSWLLARDSPLAHLWGTLLHYEGTPGLWQTVLHVLIRLGLPYSAYGFVSAGFSLIAAILWLQNAPLPLYIRLLVPFTYFLCYQYAVIARSYALIAPLLFAIAAIYPSAPRKPILTTILLCLLAAVSAHGLILSVCIWIVLYGPLLWKWSERQAGERRSLAIAALVYACVVVLVVISAWPARDAAFAQRHGEFNAGQFFYVLRAGISAAITGNSLLSLLAILLSLPFLWRGGGLLLFAMASAGIFLFGGLVYAQLWHFGVLFLVWLFAIWISAYKTRLTAAATGGLIIALAFQCYATFAAIHYDWNHVYSGSAAAAQYLRQAGISRGELYAIGFSDTAIQPYFPANIFSNLNNGGPQGYWDWSKRTEADDPGALIASGRWQPVLVGYKLAREKKLWAGVLGMLGYTASRNFGGATFWRTHIFEDESYDLYRRTSEPHALERINVVDQNNQVIGGLYDPEGQKSRWSAKFFSVLLKAPPLAERDGAQLTLKLYIPEAQIRNLGAITMTPEIGTYKLPPETFSAPNLYTYSTHVPADLLRPGFAVVYFRLDKSSNGANGDARDLGVVVTDVGFSQSSPAQ